MATIHHYFTLLLFFSNIFSPVLPLRDYSYLAFENFVLNHQIHSQEIKAVKEIFELRNTLKSLQATNLKGTFLQNCILPENIPS